MSYRTLLARATEGTDAPTPGYIYVDLAKAANGNPTACQDMAVYLSRRLASKTNPNIKYKCCKVIGKLCDDVPRNHFRRCIAQDHIAVTAIKESMHYRGTPDPVRGDEPNQKVRIAAKECLDAVYRESAPEPTSGGISSNSYGAPPHHQGSAPYSNGTGSGGLQSRMQGIGNPQFADPRLQQQQQGGFSGVVKEAGEVLVGMIKDPLARNIPDAANHQQYPRTGHSGNLPGYGGPSSNYGRPPPGSAELSRRTDGQWTMASNRGPGAVVDYQRDSAGGGGGVSAHSGAVGGSWGSAAPAHGGGGQHTASSSNYSTPRITINSTPGGGSSGGGGGGTAVSDGTYERNLVLELCPPGGLKPVPPPDKLANFARACASLNSDLVCPALLDCLEDGQPWIIRAKALCAMETAIANGTKADGSGTNPYRDFFFACQDEIAPLVSHPRPAISEPARRVLILLGVAPGSMPASTAGGASAAAAAPMAAPPNLLDFDDEPAVVAAPAPPPTHAPPPPPPNAGANNSMFGGMQVKSSGSAAAAPSMSLASAPAAPPNLLDFDAAPTTPAAPPPPPSTDVFASAEPPLTTTTSAAVPAAAATTSMFGQLSLKDTTTTNGTNDSKDVASLASNGSSAFGFINSSETATVPPPAPTSFDPLQNSNSITTPNSALKKTMQMSPEQMQAMAYQQMMMQQQQMQMQMALAMQQQQQAGTAGMMPPGMVGMVPMYPPLGGGVIPLRRTPSATGAGGGMPPLQQQFSFAPKPAKKDDKKFDFVKDAMQTAGHKK